jgi:hypothetical protein
MNSKIVLSTSLLALLAAGCTQGSSGSSGTGTITQKLSTAGAARSHGDLMPTQLVLASFDPPTKGEVLHDSDALAPAGAFAADAVSETVSTRMFRRTMSGNSPAAYTFPIDNPLGARVIVRPVDPKLTASGIHMHSVATGLRLDHGRDATNTDLGSKGTAPHAPGSEPGFAPLVMARTLSFDEPMTAGLVQLDVPPALAAAGVLVEVDQPNTHISFTGRSEELAYALGDDALFAFTLSNDGAPIEGARVTLSVELPDHTRLPDLELRSAGQGQYVASMPMSFTDPRYMGAWGLQVTATGSANGVAFERTAEAGLGFWPAHAQMSWVGTPQILRGKDGLIDEVSVDVGVTTLVDDQLSLRGLLTFSGPDGLEHTLASAQTGQVVTHEGGTVTLHFDAASLVYGQVNGPFHVRDLTLVSQGTATVQHRIGRALDLLTDKIAVTEIRMPAQIPPHVQEMIAAGDIAAPPAR